MTRTWEDHKTRVGLMAIPVVASCMLAIHQVNTATSWDALLGIVLAGAVTVLYAGTAALSTILFPYFRDLNTRAALPALYGISATVTALTTWLVLTR